MKQQSVDILNADQNITVQVWTDKYNIQVSTNHAVKLFFFAAICLRWSILLAFLSKSMRIRQFLPAWLHTPDFPGILSNCSVGAELASAGNVHDGHPRPFSLVSVSL